MGVLYSYEMGLNVMAKRVQSEAQKEYKKELERILRIVRRGEQEGYIFPEDVVPRLPKHVTKQQLEDIKRIRKEDLYEVASFVDKYTGEITEPKRKTVTRKPTVKRPRTSTTVSSEYIPHPRIPKEKPEPLSAEEKAKRRSKAAQKAWQTRTSKMSEEEYNAFIQKQVERMQQGKAKKRGTDYPTKTAIDSVTERVVDMAIRTGEVTPEEGEQIKEELSLDNFPTVNYYDGRLPEVSRKGQSNWGLSGVQTWLSEKQNVLTIWSDTLARNADSLESLEEYLIAHMGEIDESINIAEYASVLEHALQGFAQLGRILNQGALSSLQAKALSDESEFIEYDEDSYNELAEMFMR